MGPKRSVGPGGSLAVVALVAVVVVGAFAGVLSTEPTPVRAATNSSVVEGTPHLNASAPDARFSPGDSGTLSISITNDATYDYNNDTHPEEAIDRAGEARSVRVNVTDTGAAPLTVETGEQAVGTIQDGETSGPHGFSVVVDEDADAGTYEIEVTMQYRHAERVEYEEVADGEYAYNETVVNRTETSNVTVVVEPQARFEVTDVRHDVPLGGEGTVAVDLRNTGEEDVTEASVSLTSSDSDFYFGSGTATSEANVGHWSAGETKTLRFRAGTVDSAVSREYPIDVSVSYTDSEGVQQSDDEQIGITPQARTEFEVVGVSHDVPLNGEGTMTVTVAQTAGKTIEDVSVTASTSESEVYLGSESSRSATTFVDRWRAHGQRKLTFRVGTTDSAVDRSYPIELSFEYTDADDNDNARTAFVEFTPKDDERLDVALLDHDVPQNGEGTVTLRIENRGDRRVEDVSITASTTDSEIYVGSESSRSGSATVDGIPAGGNRTLTFRVGATANAVNRTYPLDLDVEYTDAEDNDNALSDSVEFRPKPEPQFRVESIDHEVAVGAAGRVTVTLRNEGPVNATRVVMTASSGDDAMFFGTGGAEPIEVRGATFEPPQTGTPTAQAYVGNWAVGETRTVSFRVGFDDDAVVRDYVADVTISYENEDGDGMPDRTKSLGIEPLPEQRFDFERVESELYVGEDGDLRGRITNNANRTVSGVVVSVESDWQNIHVYNPQYAVGELGPGESATFRFRVGITEETERGPRLFELSARYRDPEGNVRQSETRDMAVEIRGDRDAFRLETANVSFAPGESGVLRVTVKNRRNETLSNIQARLFTDDPLDSEDDSAFVPELGPGESATITVDLSVGAAASEKTYSASLDFRFDDARGDSELSDTYRVPVTVRASESTIGLPLAAGAFAALAVLAVVGWRTGALDRLRTALDRGDGPAE